MVFRLCAVRTGKFVFPMGKQILMAMDRTGAVYVRLTKSFSTKEVIQSVVVVFYFKLLILLQWLVIVTYVFQTSSLPSELPDDIDTVLIITLNTSVSPADI